MPKTTAELVDLLDLEEIEVGLFRGRQPQTQMQRTFGGQVLAQALTAAQRTVEADRAVHSLHGYFLRPGRVDAPIIYDVENLRDGSSVSSRRVRARQGGQHIFDLSTSFHIAEPGLDHGDPMPLDVPAPEDCPRMVDVLRARFGTASPLWAEWESLDVRFAGDSHASRAIRADAHRAHMRVWVRTSDVLQAATDDQPLHRAILAYLSDITLLSVSTVPHEVVFLSSRMQAASIDHAMWFHRPVRADAWLLYDQISPSASNALGFSTGRLFQDGELVASCSQEGLIRVMDRQP